MMPESVTYVKGIIASQESVKRAHRIKDEQEALVVSLSDEELYRQLFDKAIAVFTHKTKPSSMSIPVDHERDDDCYVALRIREFRDRLQRSTAEIGQYREAFDNLRKFVDSQSEDEGLWTEAQYASEAYIQRGLRGCHAMIEQEIKMLPTKESGNE